MASILKRYPKIVTTLTCSFSIGSFYLYRKTHLNETPIVKTQVSIEPIEPKLYDLPEKIDYLLVGGGTASHSAMRAIRGRDPLAKVLIISKENHTPYMRPALSKELWYSDKELRRNLNFKWWNRKERSIFFELDEFYLPIQEMIDRPTGGVSLIKNAQVIKLDPEEKVAHLENGQSIKYEKCLVAPGGSPKKLPALESAPEKFKDRIIYFRTADDFLKLEKLSDTASRIMVIGGGFLGSELACALSHGADGDLAGIFKKDIIQIFPESGNLAKILPEYLSQYITKKVEKEGSKVIPNVEVKSVTASKNNSMQVNLSNSETVEVDYIVCAVGLEPDVELAKSSGLEIDDRTGGFLVNSELEARTNIWVAGDASCFYDIKLGRRRVEHHDHAVNSGGMAGRNMVGEGKAYTHQPMFWSDIGPDVSFEAVGIIDSNLETVSVFPKDLDDEFSRGLVFYMKEQTIVGILLWNLFGRVNIARRIVNSQNDYDDINEAAKLFNIYLDE